MDRVPYPLGSSLVSSAVSRALSALRCSFAEGTPNSRSHRIGSALWGVASLALRYCTADAGPDAQGPEGKKNGSVLALTFENFLGFLIL